MSDMTGRTAAGSTKAEKGDEGVMADLKAELERTKETFKDIKEGIGRAGDSHRGGPATSVEDATTKAAGLRQAIERDVGALRSRVPEASQAVSDKARSVGPAIGGGVLALVTLVTLVKKRGRRRADDKAVREQAMAIAQELLRIEREELADPDDGGSSPLRWLLLGAAAAGAGGVAWRRSRSSTGADEVFGEPQPAMVTPPAASPR